MDSQDAFLILRSFGFDTTDGYSSLEDYLDTGDHDLQVELARYLKLDIDAVRVDEAEVAILPPPPYEELVAAETALREVVRLCIGSSWQSDLDDEKLQKLEQKRKDEDSRRDGVVVSDDLLDYAEAFHVKDLVLKNWEKTRAILLDKKRAEVLMSVMLDVRNAIAHSRPVHRHERHLLAGVAGLLQNMLAVHRNSLDGPSAHYASINYARDSFGTEAGGSDGSNDAVVRRLNPGEKVSFELSASDPFSRNVRWRAVLYHETSATPIVLGGFDGAESEYDWEVTDEHFGENKRVTFFMSNSSGFTRCDGADQSVSFSYHVNPPRP